MVWPFNGRPFLGIHSWANLRIDGIIITGGASCMMSMCITGWREGKQELLLQVGGPARRHLPVIREPIWAQSRVGLFVESKTHALLNMYDAFKGWASVCLDLQEWRICPSRFPCEWETCVTSSRQLFAHLDIHRYVWIPALWTAFILPALHPPRNSP